MFEFVLYYIHWKVYIYLAIWHDQTCIHGPLCMLCPGQHACMVHRACSVLDLISCVRPPCQSHRTERTQGRRLLVSATGRHSIMRCGWLAGADFVWENNTADLMWVMQLDVVTDSVLSPPITPTDVVTYTSDEKWGFLKITPIFFEWERKFRRRHVSGDGIGLRESSWSKMY